METDKVMLVNPFPYYAEGINEATVYPPIGLAYVASFLEERGIECKIVDANILKLTNRCVLEEIKKFAPEIIGIHTNIVLARAGIELSKKIKEDLDKVVVIGGPYATALVEKTLEESKADCIIRGEGERTMLDIIKNFSDFKKVEGISYINEGEIVHNPDRDLIKDLDSLPFPAYHLLPDLENYRSRARKTPVAAILTSRGCPYGCIYCNKNIFGRTFRARTPENIIEEIRLLVDKYGVRQIDILDDNFTFDIERAERTLDLIIDNGFDLAINCQNGVRADRLTEHLVHKMKKAGVFKVGIGIESGDENIIKVINKSLDLEKVKTAIEWFKREGIMVYGFFMIGLPGETKETMQKTIDFAKEVDPHIANFSIAIPFPGTKFYDMIEKEGRFTGKIDGTSGFYGEEFYYELGEVNKKLALQYHRKAYREFYFRPSKVIDLLKNINSWSEFKWTVAATLPLLRNIAK